MNAPVQLASRVAIADLSDRIEVDRIERFVAGRDASPFHRPLWLRAIEEGAGQKALGLILEREGQLAGWLPLTDVHSPIFGRALVSSGFAVGGGPLADRPSDAEALCKAAQELAGRRSAASVELRGGHAPAGWQVTSTSHCNFARELAEDDEAELLAIPRKARAEVRKGLKNDLSVSTGSSPHDRAMHYSVYSESVRNLGTPVFPRTLFDAVLDGFGEDADILTVSHQGRAVASVLSLYHRGTVMPYWGGGVFAARTLRANERMYYELMGHARRRGCTRFDFGRSKTGSGPYSFKKNWGFEPEPMVYSHWSADPAQMRNVDPTDEGHAAKIALWKRLPLGVTNRVGPWIARGLG